jgi:hypothetical protein
VYINDLIQEQIHTLPESLTSSDDTSDIIYSQNVDDFSSVSDIGLFSMYEWLNATKLAVNVNNMDMVSL